MPTHTSKTIANQIEFYEDRAKKVDLIWCQQIVSLLNIYEQEKVSINDIGCNYGQFYKELKRTNVTDRFKYRGYDKDPNFIEIGKKYFADISDNFEVFDIENFVPPKSDITICSATLEHLDKPLVALENMLNSTTKEIYLRTWVGTSKIEEIQSDVKYVLSPYNINQFNLFELSQLFFERNFNFLCIPDLATNHSKEYEPFKNAGIFRTMYIIKGTKILET